MTQKHVLGAINHDLVDHTWIAKGKILATVQWHWALYTSGLRNAKATLINPLQICQFWPLAFMFTCQLPSIRGSIWRRSSQQFLSPTTTINLTKMTSPASNDQQRATIIPVVECLLISGRGKSTEQTTLIPNDEKISFASAHAELPEPFKSLAASKVPVIMPGKWNSYVHFWGADRYSIQAASTTGLILAGPVRTRSRCNAQRRLHLLAQGRRLRHHPRPRRCRGLNTRSAYLLVRKNAHSDGRACR